MDQEYVGVNAAPIDGQRVIFTKPNLAKYDISQATAWQRMRLDAALEKARLAEVQGEAARSRRPPKPWAKFDPGNLTSDDPFASLKS